VTRGFLSKLIFNLLFVFFLFCGINLANGKDDSKSAAFVEVAAVKSEPFAKKITVVGTLRAKEGVVIRPEVAGKITAIYFKSGTEVDIGAPLIQLNPDLAVAELKKSESDLQLAEQKYQRAKTLYQMHAIATADFEEISAQRNNNLDQVSEDKAKLAKTLIKAPFSGKLGMSLVSLGDYVTEGQDLVSLKSIDPIEVEFNVSQVYLNNLFSGQKIAITSDAYPEQKLTGQIYAIDAEVNLTNRTVMARATIPNPEGKLVPGTFVEIQLDFTGGKNVLIIPQIAAIYDAGQTYVYKVVANKAVKTKVVLGERDQENVVVLEGLNANDLVITAGQLNIDDGAVVEFANSKQ
jgi:membrane fusion protein, multidrug efflux system